jgi:hypothetical protein
MENPTAWIPVGYRLPEPNPDNEANSIEVLFYPNLHGDGWGWGRLWYKNGMFQGPSSLGYLKDPLTPGREVTHWMYPPSIPK